MPQIGCCGGFVVAILKHMDSLNNYSLAEIRQHIDGIDRKIVGLIAERQRWVFAAGRLKRDEDGVRDAARVEKVIAKVRDMAVGQGAAPDIVEDTYRTLIAGFIALELGEYHRLGENGADLVDQMSTDGYLEDDFESLNLESRPDPKGKPVG